MLGVGPTLESRRRFNQGPDPKVTVGWYRQTPEIIDLLKMIGSRVLPVTSERKQMRTRGTRKVSLPRVLRRTEGFLSLRAPTLNISIGVM